MIKQKKYIYTFIMNLRILLTSIEKKIEFYLIIKNSLKIIIITVIKKICKYNILSAATYLNKSKTLINLLLIIII